MAIGGAVSFGGPIGKWLPSLVSFPIYELDFDTGDLGIPVDQHPGTEDVNIPIFVENYGVDVLINSSMNTPTEIKPGTVGNYIVTPNNIGSLSDTFDTWEVTFTNQENQTSPFGLGIDKDNDGDGQIDEDGSNFNGSNDGISGYNDDFDCLDENGDHFIGAYDNTVDDCFDENNLPKAGFTELIDEDPTDLWESVPDNSTLLAKVTDVVPPHQKDTNFVLGITPFQHYSLTPGVYPFAVEMDSTNATNIGLDRTDASGHNRTDSFVIGYFNASAFYEPRVEIQDPKTRFPADPTILPGNSVNYTIQVRNAGNAPPPPEPGDIINVTNTFIDFNQGGCNLTTLGSESLKCPFRAFPTVMQDDWPENLDDILIDNFGPLKPGATNSSTITITAPSNWAGMEDTTYQFELNATSQKDPATPPASTSSTGNFTIIATKESNTRFIGLEIRELIQNITRANAEGIKTHGSLPISLNAMERTNNRTLNLIENENLDGADHPLSANIYMTKAFKHQLAPLLCDGPENKCAYFEAWDKAADAIIDDLITAIANDKSSQLQIAVSNSKTLSSDASYIFGGFTTPSLYAQYEKGQIIPVKVSVLDSNYQPVEDAIVTIFWIEKTGPKHEIPAKSNDPNQGNTAQFKHDLYNFNMLTDEMDEGDTIIIRVHLDDDTHDDLKVFIR
jgi:hypothetical protein